MPPDFLLFIPANAPGLHAVLSYYQNTTKLNAEGDVHLSDEALQGLGMMLNFLKTSLFGAVIQLAKPTQSHAGGSNTSPIAMWEDSEARPQLHFPEEDEDMIEINPHIPTKPARRKELSDKEQRLQDEVLRKRNGPSKLMDYVPDVGYFLAGGLAGVTSRTATAPLDRLKVYLIAQTGNAEDTVQAVKSAKPISAAQHGVRTLWNACQHLWAAGGMRSLFAGEHAPSVMRLSSIANIVQAMVSM